MKAIKLDKLIIAIPLVLLLVVGAYFFVFKSDRPLTGNVVLEPVNNQNALQGNQDDELYARILLEEANEQNIKVNESDVDNAIEVLIARSQMAEEDFYNFILNQYPSREEFRGRIKNNLKIIKLIDQNVDLNSIEATDGDVGAFIEENKEVMPLEQLNNDTEFRENFYRLAKQQLVQNKQQELINEYLKRVMEKRDKG